MRRLRVMVRAFGWIAAVDWLVHRMHIKGRVARWVCYRFDLACGMTEREAGS